MYGLSKSMYIRLIGGVDKHQSNITTPTITGNTSRNNVPNKTLLVGTFVCAVVGTLRSTFCVPDTVLDVPDIIWNILPNNIRHIFLISKIGSYYYQAFVLKLNLI